MFRLFLSSFLFVSIALGKRIHDAESSQAHGQLQEADLLLEPHFFFSQKNSLVAAPDIVIDDPSPMPLPESVLSSNLDLNGMGKRQRHANFILKPNLRVQQKQNVVISPKISIKSSAVKDETGSNSKSTDSIYVPTDYVDSDSDTKAEVEGRGRDRGKDWDVNRDVDPRNLKSDALFDSFLQMKPDSTPSTVDVRLDSLLGIWFETHRSQIPSATFEKDLVCVTSRFHSPESASFLGIFKEVPTVKVHHEGRLASPTGDLKSADGAVWQFDEKHNSGKLLVTMKSTVGSMFIHLLGPLNEEGRAEYAVLTDNLGTSVWILARKPKHFRTSGALDKVLALLKTEGFDEDWNKPLPSYQGQDCQF